MMLVADAAVQEPPVLPFHRIQVDGPLELAARASATSPRCSRP